MEGFNPFCFSFRKRCTFLFYFVHMYVKQNPAFRQYILNLVHRSTISLPSLAVLIWNSCHNLFRNWSAVCAACCFSFVDFSYINQQSISSALSVFVCIFFSLLNKQDWKPLCPLPSQSVVRWRWHIGRRTCGERRDYSKENCSKVLKCAFIALLDGGK